MTITQALGLTLPLFAIPQAPASRPAAEPAVVLSKAKLAQDLGQADEAEVLLRQAAASGRTDVAEEAQARLAVVRQPLGGGAQAEEASTSPLELRIRELLSKADPQEPLRQLLRTVGNEATPILRKVISDRNLSGTRRDMLLKVASWALSGPEARDFILEHLQAEDPLERAAAASAIWNVRMSEPERAALVEQLAAHKDGLVREWIPAELVPFASLQKRLLPALVADRVPRVRARVVEHLATNLDATQRAALERDPDPTVRTAVVFRMRELKWPITKEAVIAFAQDPDSEVATAMLEYNTSVPDLRTALGEVLAKRASDPDANIRRCVARNSSTPLGARLALAADPVEHVATGARQLLTNWGDLVRGAEDLRAVAQALRTAGDQFGFADPLRKENDTSPRNPTRADLLLGALSTPSTKLKDFGIVEFRELIFAHPKLLTQAPRDRGLHPILSSLMAPKHVPGAISLMKEATDPELKAALRRFVLGYVDDSTEGNKPEVLSLVREVLEQSDDERDVKQAISVALAFGSAEFGDTVIQAIRRVPSSVNRFAEELPRLLFADKWSKNIETAARIGLVCLTEPKVLSSSWGWQQSLMRRLRGAAPKLVAASAKALVTHPSMPMFATNAPSSYRPYLDAICESLAASGDAASLETLRAWASGNPVVQELEYTAFGALQSLPTAVEDMLTFAGDERSALRLLAAQEIAKKHYKDPRAKELLTKLLKSEHPAIQQAAITGLGNSLSPDVAPLLVEQLASSDPELRKEAEQALARMRTYHEERKRWEDWYRGRGIDPGEGVRKVLEMLDDADAQIRAAAIDSLGTMKAKEALPILIERMKKASGAERDAIAKAVAKINQ